MAKIAIGLMPVRVFCEKLAAENADGDVFCMVRQRDKHVMCVALDADSVKFVAKALEEHGGAEIWHPDMFELMAFGGKAPPTDHELLQEMGEDGGMRDLENVGSDDLEHQLDDEIGDVFDQNKRGGPG